MLNRPYWHLTFVASIEPYWITLCFTYNTTISIVGFGDSAQVCTTDMPWYLYELSETNLLPFTKVFRLFDELSVACSSLSCNICNILMWLSIILLMYLMIKHRNDTYITNWWGLLCFYVNTSTRFILSSVMEVGAITLLVPPLNPPLITMHMASSDLLN